MRAALAKGMIFYLVVPYFNLVLGIALLGVGTIYVSLVAIPTTLGWLKAGLQKIRPSAPTSVYLNRRT